MPSARDDIAHCCVPRSPAVTQEVVWDPDTLVSPYYSTETFFGPWLRGWGPARRIFISSTGGAPGAARCGITEVEWEAGRSEREELAAATTQAVLADLNMPRSLKNGRRTIPIMPRSLKDGRRTIIADGVFNIDVYDEAADRKRKEDYKAKRKRSALCCPFAWVWSF